MQRIDRKTAMSLMEAGEYVTVGGDRWRKCNGEFQVERLIAGSRPAMWHWETVDATEETIGGEGAKFFVQ